TGVAEGDRLVGRVVGDGLGRLPPLADREEQRRHRQLPEQYRGDRPRTAGPLFFRNVALDSFALQPLRQPSGLPLGDRLRPPAGGRAARTSCAAPARSPRRCRWRTYTSRPSPRPARRRACSTRPTPPCRSRRKSAPPPSPTSRATAAAPGPSARPGR